MEMKALEELYRGAFADVEQKEVPLGMRIERLNEAVSRPFVTPLCPSKADTSPSASGPTCQDERGFSS